MNASAPLTLSEAQRIAESIVGPVDWHDAQGPCRCPGEDAHTTATARIDCKAVCAPVLLGSGVLAPGVYCFHDHCQAVVYEASQRLRSALGRCQPSGTPRYWQPSRPAPPPVAFRPEKLAKLAAKVPIITPEFLASISSIRVDNRTPASFLHALYMPGEHVVIFDVFESQGQAVWRCQLPPFDACELDGFSIGARCGVWFLANPVTGEWELNDGGSSSRRSWQNVTSWRYLVLESDEADSAQWLGALVQMPLPIASIVTSGGKSIHALVRIDASSKGEWDAIVGEMKPWLVTLGADRSAMSAVRLTRLPCCQRLGVENQRGVYHAYDHPRPQALLYLNPNPERTPLVELPQRSDQWQATEGYNREEVA